MNILENSAVVSKIIEIVNKPDFVIGPNTKFYDIPDMDSLNTMNVVGEIEDRYDIVVNLHNVDSTLTISDLALLVIEEIKNQ